MIAIRHRFLNHPIGSDTETLILGTFNPDIKGNEADFFYGRSRNFLWRLLPLAYNEPDLKKASKPEKLAFILKHKIGFIDLIAEISVDAGEETNYNDDFIDGRVTRWQEVILGMKKLKALKRVGFTRRTLTGIPGMKSKIEVIASFCNEHGIYFKPLPTPSRFYRADKQEEWTKFFYS